MRTLHFRVCPSGCHRPTLSVIFIGLAHSDGWSSRPACSMAESLCRRPSLLATPVLVAIAWGLMLLVTDK
jgi:hypothetical protein